VKVYRVRIGDFPLLADVALAAAAAPRAGRLIRSGAWPPPHPPNFDRDIPRPLGRFCATHDFTPLRELALRWPIELRSFISYPQDGGISWHTDSRDQGWRVYIPIEAGAYFYANDRAESLIHAVPDVDGYANVFHVGPDWRDNWHCVRAAKPRTVLGFRLLVDPWRLTDPWTLIGT
jgi:hypothetical protein